MKKTAIFTISANSYLPQQRLFINQLRQIYPSDSCDVYCIFLEKNDVSSPEFKSVYIDKVKSIKNLQFLKFKYNPMELATSLKPFIFLWLFKQYDYEKILYFDSDIFIQNLLTLITDKLDNYDVVLTPHIREPINDSRLPNELDFTRSGYFNMGFIAFKKSAPVIDFLKWWSARTDKYCYIDFTKNFFVDQRWIDYAPIFLNAYIIKEPGYNVAYFNLQEYIGKIDPKKIFFIHFSGFDSEKISVYQNRFTKNSIGRYRQLFDRYHASLTNQRYQEKKPYSYEKFDNGIFICPAIKNIFKQMEFADKIISRNRPFSTGQKNSPYHFLNSRINGAPCTQIVKLLYETDKEIQNKFPVITFEQFSPAFYQYAQWFITNAGNELLIDNDFINKQQKIFEEITPFLWPYKYEYPKKFKIFQFIKLLSLISIHFIANPETYATNLYLFLLNRSIDEKTAKEINNAKKKHPQIKKNILSSLILSSEFKQKKGHKLVLNICLKLLLWL